MWTEGLRVRWREGGGRGGAGGMLDLTLFVDQGNGRVEVELGIVMGFKN